MGSHFRNPHTVSILTDLILQMRATEAQRGEGRSMQTVNGEVGTYTQAVSFPGPNMTSWPH